MEALFLLAKIMMVNIVLSGDNAVVIAMASRNLPDEQRAKAIWWGAALAVALRVLLTAAAVMLLNVPWIQLIGGFLLLYIAIKLLADDDGGDHVQSASTLGAAVWTIVVADFVMSLDNVLAIAAIADGNWLLIFVGILVSIPLIVWGSAYVVNLLKRYPVLVYIGAAVLGYTAGEMFLKDRSAAAWLAQIPQTLHWLLPLAAAAIAVAAGQWRKGKAAG